MEKRVTIDWENLSLRKSYEALSPDDQLKKKIDYVLDQIKKNPKYGQLIPTKQVPREYKKKGFYYAFWVKLTNSWRLIYTVTAYGKIEILAIILDYMNHKDYERKFKY